MAWKVYKMDLVVFKNMHPIEPSENNTLIKEKKRGKKRGMLDYINLYIPFS